MKLLYLSCHEVLEFDEISLFRELGIEVFSARTDSASMLPRLRPLVPRGVSSEDDAAAFAALARPGRPILECLTREFVDRFDAVMVMHMPEKIMANWEAMRHKPVIWRTIGQSVPAHELTMQSYRSDGLRIVRYSPAERRLADHAGEDAIIRFYKDPREWGGWTGERPVVVCFSQFMPLRSVHCNYDTLLRVTQGLPCELYGPDNQDAGPLWRGCLSYEDLRLVLRTSRACFHTGTFPASYTLGFIEAWMTGIPVVSVGQQLFARAGRSLAGLYEVPDLIEHEVNGFASDQHDELQSCLRCLLTHWDYAREVSEAGRASALALFDKELVREQWRQLFATLPCS